MQFQLHHRQHEAWELRMLDAIAEVPQGLANLALELEPEGGSCWAVLEKVKRCLLDATDTTVLDLQMSPSKVGVETAVPGQNLATPKARDQLPPFSRSHRGEKDSCCGPIHRFRLPYGYG